MAQLPLIPVAANSTTYGVIHFNLNQLTNQASFKNLFDLYRITAVKCSFMFRNNSADTNLALNTGQLPILYTAINRDPFSPPPISVADVLNDDTCRIHRCDSLVGKGGIYIKSPKPDMTSLVYAGGEPTGGSVIQQWNLGVGNNKQYWLTTGGSGAPLDQSGVNHYGIRYALDNLGNANPQEVQVFATLYFQMKEQN